MAAVTTAVVQNKEACVNTIFQTEESTNLSSLLSQNQAKPEKNYQIKIVAENDCPVMHEKGDPCFLI